MQRALRTFSSCSVGFFHGVSGRLIAFFGFVKDALSSRCVVYNRNRRKFGAQFDN